MASSRTSSRSAGAGQRREAGEPARPRPAPLPARPARRTAAARARPPTGRRHAAASATLPHPALAITTSADRRRAPSVVDAADAAHAVAPPAFGQPGDHDPPPGRCHGPPPGGDVERRAAGADDARRPGGAPTSSQPARRARRSSSKRLNAPVKRQRSSTGPTCGSSAGCCGTQTTSADGVGDVVGDVVAAPALAHRDHPQAEQPGERDHLDGDVDDGRRAVEPVHAVGEGEGPATDLGAQRGVVPRASRRDLRRRRVARERDDRARELTGGAGRPGRDRRRRPPAPADAGARPRRGRRGRTRGRARTTGRGRTVMLRQTVWRAYGDVPVARGVTWRRGPAADPSGRAAGSSSRGGGQRIAGTIAARRTSSRPGRRSRRGQVRRRASRGRERPPATRSACPSGTAAARTRLDGDPVPQLVVVREREPTSTSTPSSVARRRSSVRRTVGRRRIEVPAPHVHRQRRRHRRRSPAIAAERARGRGSDAGSPRARRRRRSAGAGRRRRRRSSPAGTTWGWGTTPATTPVRRRSSAAAHGVSVSTASAAPTSTATASWWARWSTRCGLSRSWAVYTSPIRSTPELARPRRQLRAVRCSKPKCTCTTSTRPASASDAEDVLDRHGDDAATAVGGRAGRCGRRRDGRLGGGRPGPAHAAARARTLAKQRS